MKKIFQKIGKWFQDHVIGVVLTACLVFTGLYTTGYFIRSIKM